MVTPPLFRGCAVTVESNLSAIERQGHADAEAAFLAKDGGLSLASQVINAVLGSAFMIIVGRLLPRDQAGGLFEATALFSTVAIVAQAGSDVGLMKLMPLRRRLGRKSAISTTLAAAVPVTLLSILLAACIWELASPMAHLMITQQNLQATGASELRLLAPCIPCATVATTLLAATRAWSVRPSAIIPFIVVPALRVTAMMVLLATGFTLLRATALWGMAALVGLGLSAYACASTLKASNFDNEGATEVNWWRDGALFWAFATPRFVESSLMVVLWGADVVLVGSLSTPSVAADYAVASRYIAIGTMALPAVLIAIPPRVSELLNDKRIRDAQRLYRIATTWILIVAFPAVAALTVWADNWMSIFGQSYETGGSALRLLTLSVVFNCASGPAGAVLLMAGSGYVNLGITAAAVSTNIGLMVILVPAYGLIGAAWAAVGSIALMNALLALMVWRRCQMAPPVRELGLVAANAGVTMGLIPESARLLFGSSDTVMVLSLLTGCVGYSIALALLRGPLHLSVPQLILGGRQRQAQRGKTGASA